MREHVIPAVISAVVATGVGYGAAVGYKPHPIIMAPTTTVVSRTPATGSSVVSVSGVSATQPCDPSTGPAGALCSYPVPVAQTPLVSRSDARRIAASWGELDQKEIDDLTSLVKGIKATPLTIFCWRDELCGDMQLDFDNALETAHWTTKLETPLIDDTVGVATSREDLRDAINQATHNRLDVKIIAKNAPYDVLVIGKRR